MRKFIAVYLVCILFYSNGFSQKIPAPGTWQYHLKPRNYPNLEIVENTIYANGTYALVKFDANSRESSQIHKINGLSEYSISNVFYFPSPKYLLVCYTNSVMDLIDLSQGKLDIYSNFDLANKIFIGAKFIYDAQWLNNKIYLATSMGIVVWNPEKNLIEATYVIGENGENSKVMGVTKKDQTFYAISNNKLKTAQDLPSLNLQNFELWEEDNSLNDSIIQVLNYKNEIYAFSFSKIYIKENNNWRTYYNAPDSFRILKSKIYNQNLYVHLKHNSTNSSSIWDVSSYNTKEILPVNKIGANDFSFSASNQLFLTSMDVFEYKNGNIELLSVPPAPGFSVQNIQMLGDEMVVNTGKLLDNLYTNENYEGCYIWQTDNNWREYGIWNEVYKNKNIRTQMSTLKIGDDIYRAFARGGLFVEKPDGKGIQYDTTNSTLQNSTFGEIEIIDMQQDKNTNIIWFILRDAKNPLVSFHPESGKWRMHPFKNIEPDREFRKMLIDKQGHKWILTRSKGVLFFDENEPDNDNDDIWRQYFSIEDGNCKLDINRPQSITESVQKSSFSSLTFSIVWVGGERGVGGFFDCTDDSKLPCQFTIPATELIDPNNNKDTFYECAFLNTNVNAMATDGGNRLWVGVGGGGLFYLEEDFNTKYKGISNEYLRFTKQNSPFPGNDIYNILVHPKTGHVGVTTDIGFFTYMGMATEGTKEEPRFLRVTPNPVPRDYSGLISIDDLPDNSMFKITDVVGNLVYQGITNGGRIVWDGKDLRGLKPPTGVYFVFTAQRGTLKDAMKRVGSFTIIN